MKKEKIIIQKPTNSEIVGKICLVCQKEISRKNYQGYHYWVRWERIYHDKCWQSRQSNWEKKTKNTQFKGRTIKRVWNRPLRTLVLFSGNRRGQWCAIVSWWKKSIGHFQ